MPKVSKQNAAHVDDFGVAEDHHEDVDGYTVNFVTIRQDYDLGPMLEALPGGKCPCPHWGFVLKGRLTIRYDDGGRPSRRGRRSTCPRGMHQLRRPAPSSCSSVRPASWRPPRLPS
jgi:hypothetical protein